MSNLQGSTLNNQREQSHDFKQEPNVATKANPGNKLSNNKVAGKGKSFAQQMAALNSKTRNTNEVEKDQFADFDPSVDLNEEEFAKLPDDLKAKYIKERQNRQQKINSNTAHVTPEEGDQQQLENSQRRISQQQQDTQRAMQQSQGQEAAQMQEIDEESHYESKQETIAHAAQEKQEQVNQAAAQQQQQQQTAEEHRKQQLAHWEILAPRLLEDGRNKAIRLDIPDVDDVKTVIVKMRGNSVDVQAIGSKDLVKIFRTKEGMLRASLAKKNVRMGSTRVLDAAAIYGA